MVLLCMNLFYVLHVYNVYLCFVIYILQLSMPPAWPPPSNMFGNVPGYENMLSGELALP